MTERRSFDEESSAVQTHLGIIQDVIRRMAENSRSCKVWCVTLISAILVLVARAAEPQHVFIALVPTLLLMVLDLYYLALERAFRCSYKEFVDKLHNGSLEVHDVYRIQPAGSIPKTCLRCLTSFSIYAFYPFILGTVIVAWWVIAP